MKFKEKVSTHGAMVEHLRVIGKLINSMVMGNLNGQMVEAT